MLDRQNGKPLYAQLHEIISDKIESEQWKPHTPIPSENELSKVYGISRMTARSVVTQFVRDGWLYRVPGKGTFVSEPKITTHSLSYMGIREQLEQMGYQISTTTISSKKIPCPEALAKKLALGVGTEIYVIKRVRFIKDEPLSLHTSYIPAALCQELEGKDLEGEQLCVILEKDYGLIKDKVVETLESTSAGETEAQLLRIRQGYPLLLLEDTIYSTSGAPFEYTKVLFRGDKIKIRFEFNS